MTPNIQEINNTSIQDTFTQDPIQLSEHQQEVYDKALSYLNDYNNQGTILKIKGSAGVGKTTLVGKLVDELSVKNKIQITGPTHKSVRVLESKTKAKNSSNVKISTIHSFLKLKLTPCYETGLQKLVEDTFGNKGGDRTDILIVDEMSMLSTELNNYIINKLERKQIKFVIMTGDDYQLLPVSEDDEKPIESDYTLELEEVVRQAEGNPIIKYAQEIKEHIKTKDYIENKLTLRDMLHNLLNDSSIKVTNSPQEFIKEWYHKDPSEDKFIVTFTNKVVKLYNTGVRRDVMGVTGVDVEEYIVGENLVFNEAYTDGSYNNINNSEIITISQITSKYDATHNLNYWQIVDSDKRQFRVIASSSKDNYIEILSKLAQDAQAAESGYNKKRAWAAYFALKSEYASVDYTYSGTIHRCQGSTYESVYFHLSNLMNSHIEMDMALRLAYVAITRSSDKLYILA